MVHTSHVIATLLTFWKKMDSPVVENVDHIYFLLLLLLVLFIHRGPSGRVCWLCYAVLLPF